LINENGTQNNVMEALIVSLSSSWLYLGGAIAGFIMT